MAGMNDITTGTKLRFFDGFNSAGEATWGRTLWEVGCDPIVCSDGTTKVYSLQEVKPAGKRGRARKTQITMIEGCNNPYIKVEG